MSNIEILTPDPTLERHGFDLLNSMMRASINDRGSVADALGSMKLAFPVPKVLPCANNLPSAHQYCNKAGTLACGGCKLVSYCSKKCQQENWRDHKQDCKHKMRSPQWKPEHVPDGSTNWRIDPFADAGTLWGKGPAFDFLRLENNEKSTSRDYNLAFVASADLRHVIETVNSLPKVYSGKLTVLLNDDDPLILARTMTILLLLTRVQDLTIAVETALHFWYSAFLPSDYRLQYIAVLSAFVKEKIAVEGDGKSFSTTLVNQCSASFIVSPTTWNACKLFLAREPAVHTAQDGFSVVQRGLDRKKYRDFNFFSMRPSHRVAIWQYQSYGLALPHGALNAHFNRTNSSLFKPPGEWLQNDQANMFAGWDIDEIVKVGIKHGAHSEDIFGCFYFMMTEKLKAFAERLRTLRISFLITNIVPSKIPRYILSDTFVSLSIPRITRFHRVHLSNVIEERPHSLEDVITEWAPILSNSASASILCDFFDWTDAYKWKTSFSEEEMVVAFERLMRDRKIPGFEPSESLAPKAKFLKFLEAFPTQGLSDVCSHCDTSNAFRRYLNQLAFTETLGKLGLQERQQHKIVPHRIHVPVDASVDSLPAFVGQDSWYLNTKLTGYTWTERFVEIGRPSSAST